MVELLGIEALSGGEKQRGAIGRALLANWRLLQAHKAENYIEMLGDLIARATRYSVRGDWALP